MGLEDPVPWARVQLIRVPHRPRGERRDGCAAQRSARQSLPRCFAMRSAGCVAVQAGRTARRYRMDRKTGRAPQLAAALPPHTACCITELCPPSIPAQPRTLKRRVMHLHRPRRRSAGMLRMCKSGQAARCGMLAMARAWGPRLCRVPGAVHAQQFEEGMQWSVAHSAALSGWSVASDC